MDYCGDRCGTRVRGRTPPEAATWANRYALSLRRDLDALLLLCRTLAPSSSVAVWDTLTSSACVTRTKEKEQGLILTRQAWSSRDSTAGPLARSLRFLSGTMGYEYSPQGPSSVQRVRATSAVTKAEALSFVSGSPGMTVTSAAGVRRPIALILLGRRHWDCLGFWQTRAVEISPRFRHVSGQTSTLKFFAGQRSDACSCCGISRPHCMTRVPNSLSVMPLGVGGGGSLASSIDCIVSLPKCLLPSTYTPRERVGYRSSLLTPHSVDGVPGGISSLTACRAWAREW